MMKLRVLVIALVAIVSLNSFKGEKSESKDVAVAAATASVEGVVVDDVTGESLAGVLVTLEGTELKAYTDFDGKFTFAGVKVGTYSVKADLISYKKVELNKIEVKADKESMLNVKMKLRN